MAHNYLKNQELCNNRSEQVRNSDERGPAAAYVERRTLELVEHLGRDLSIFEVAALARVVASEIVAGEHLAHVRQVAGDVVALLELPSCVKPPLRARPLLVAEASS